MNLPINELLIVAHLQGYAVRRRRYAEQSRRLYELRADRFRPQRTSRGLATPAARHPHRDTIGIKGIPHNETLSCHRLQVYQCFIVIPLILHVL